MSKRKLIGLCANTRQVSLGNLCRFNTDCSFTDPSYYFRQRIQKFTVGVRFYFIFGSSTFVMGNNWFQRCGGTAVSGLEAARTDRADYNSQIGTLTIGTMHTMTFAFIHGVVAAGVCEAAWAGWIAQTTDAPTSRGAEVSCC